MSFIKKNWWWLLILAGLVIWIVEGTDSVATDIRKKFQTALNNIQQGLWNVASGAAEAGAIVIVVFIAAVVLDAPVVVVAAAAAVLVWAAHKVLGWFSGLFGSNTPAQTAVQTSTSSSTPVTAGGPVATPTTYDSNYTNFNPADNNTWPVGTIINSDGTTITLPDGNTYTVPGGNGYLSLNGSSDVTSGSGSTNSGVNLDEEEAD